MAEGGLLEAAPHPERTSSKERNSQNFFVVDIAASSAKTNGAAVRFLHAIFRGP